MDFVSALSGTIPVVQMLQEIGQHIISVTATSCGKEPLYVHIVEPTDKTVFSRRVATVKRVQHLDEWAMDIDGVRVFWLQKIEGESAARTVTL